MKKNFLVVVSLVSIFFIACKKDAKCPYSETSVVAPVAETDSIKKYLIAQNITTAVQHPSGIFYTIGTAGSGATPELCSDLTVQYQGYLFSGAQFDGTNGSAQATFTLGRTIEGWKKGLPLAKPGGTLTLYIPPSLGYGSNPIYQGGVLVIPANSYLRFTVNLIAVQ
ncbi:FKBP-type peptidyl-prolyl cis-trans isomerase [Ferruginibacter sp. HRS2-29]|uniref:FKBP-type peptidyl-prolyl cis-trans isomerase n=1 Tax=Ferruginibacter sp. HRS2-29 TaxID=2487334 RepID=UPI0020CED33A|nr:FKBP-type peptidyl-prolyl cis-trans isomerase [Ferruginibacter sp. HRS2-29]MCP9753095.1 FKBP-type peptidylprolyl isomerase [Ferruginibacter sp. HRS2-29]